MCEIDLFQVINLDQRKKEKMVLITSLDAKSLSFPSAAVRNSLTTSLISLTASFTRKLKSLVPIEAGLFRVDLPR